MKKERKNVDMKKKTESKSVKQERKLESKETKSKDIESKVSNVSQISKLEQTIEALDAEIRDVKDKLKSRKVTDGTAETIKSAKITTTTEREESTYFPMHQENVSSNQSEQKGEKKIRIKLPQRKVEKPKIQPYEFPLTEALTKVSSSFENESESTTIVYAIPYIPDEEESVTKYRRF